MALPRVGRLPAGLRVVLYAANPAPPSRHTPLHVVTAQRRAARRHRRRQVLQGARCRLLQAADAPVRAVPALPRREDGLPEQRRLAVPWRVGALLAHDGKMPAEPLLRPLGPRVRRALALRATSEPQARLWLAARLASPAHRGTNARNLYRVYVCARARGRCYARNDGYAQCLPKGSCSAKDGWSCEVLEPLPPGAPSNKGGSGGGGGGGDGGGGGGGGNPLVPVVVVTALLTLVVVGGIRAAVDIPTHGLAHSAALVRPKRGAGPLRSTPSARAASAL